MRLLHTADWHAGRNLRGIDRTPEIVAALEQILSMARETKADAILVAGDLFDTQNPSAEAETAVYRFFLEAGRIGIPCAVIAGNHDSGQRLESVAGLLKHVNVTMLGTVKPGMGSIELETRAGLLRVAALPFLSERRLVKAAMLLETGLDVGAWRQKYREGMEFFLRKLEAGFKDNAVNTMMLHTTVDGGMLSQTEHSFHVGNSYSISPDVFPSSAQYVALGHLHKPQSVNDLPPAQYSGSVIQLDFGEAGDEKRVNLIEVEPGRRAKITSLPLTLVKPLKTVRVDLDSLERRLEEFQSFQGWLKVIVSTPEPKPGLKDRVIGVLPSALAIEVELTEGTKRVLEAAPEHLTPIEAFERYYSEKRGADLPENVRKAFMELQLEINGELPTEENVLEDASDHEPPELEQIPLELMEER